MPVGRGVGCASEIERETTLPHIVLHYYTELGVPVGRGVGCANEIQSSIHYSTLPVGLVSSLG